MSVRDTCVREAQETLRHYFDHAGVLTDPDCGSEIDTLVERIVEAAEASARRTMTHDELRADLAALGGRAREAVAVTVPGISLAGLPQTITRDELLAASAVTAASVYLALLERFGVEVTS